MTSSVPQQPSPWSAMDEVSTEDLARQQGVRPITSAEQITALGHPDAFESEQEFQEFLADLYASQHSDAS